MNVNDLVNQSRLYRSLQGGQAASSTSSLSSVSSTSASASNALSKASERTSQQLESTKVQLSSYGQIKSSLSEVQSASKTLSDPQKTATVSDVKKAVEGFVNAYNKANSAVDKAVQGDGKRPGALADDSRAKVTDNNLQRSLSAGSNLADLKKIGITQGKDGSLSIDTTKLNAALQSNSSQVRSTVAGVASQVEKTATRELSSTGNVGSSVNALTNRSRDLQKQLSSQQDQAAATQRSVDQYASRLNDVFATGISAYQRMGLG